MPLRKESARTGPLRLIDVQDYDLSACGGTHVDRTGAIGMIAIAGWEKFKGGSRVEFLCGGRALQRFRVWRGALSAVQKHLSVPPIEMAASIERMQDDAKADSADRPRFPGKARRSRGAGAWQRARTHRRHAVDRGSARGLGSAGTQGDRRRGHGGPTGSGRRAVYVVCAGAGRDRAWSEINGRRGRAAETPRGEIWREGRRETGSRSGRRTRRAGTELIAYLRESCRRARTSSTVPRFQVPEVWFCGSRADER